MYFLIKNKINLNKTVLLKDAASAIRPGAGRAKVCGRGTKKECAWDSLMGASAANLGR